MNQAILNLNGQQFSRDEDFAIGMAKNMYRAGLLPTVDLFDGETWVATIGAPFFKMGCQPCTTLAEAQILERTDAEARVQNFLGDQKGDKYSYFDEYGKPCNEEQAVRRVYSPMGYTVEDIRGKVGDDWVLWHKLCEGRVGNYISAEIRLCWAMNKGPAGDMYREVLNTKVFLMEERVFQGKIYGVKLSGYGPEKTWKELLALAKEKLGERPDHIHILDSFGEWKSHVDTVHAEPNWDERVVYFERGVGWPDDDLSFDQSVGSASEVCIDLWHERG